MIFTAKSVLRYGTIAIVGCLLLFYVYTQSITYIRGPQLSIHSPEDGISTTTQMVTIRGNTRNISFITTNGVKTYADEDGEFEHTLLLNPGYNIITVNVTDRFNRSLTKSIHLTYIKEHSDSPPIPSFSTTTPRTATSTEAETTGGDIE